MKRCCTLALLLLLGVAALTGPASAAMDGWDYYQEISYSACDQDNYQQDVVIHRYWTSGAASETEEAGLNVWNIGAAMHCQEDYGDIRFTDAAGTELDYYLWPDYDAETARFCVRLTGATSAGEVRVWYGNAAAETTSDEDATFDWFSDTLDEWSPTGIPYSEGTGTIDGIGGIHVKSTNSAAISWPSNLPVDPAGKRMEMGIRSQSSTQSNAQFRMQITDNSDPDPGHSNGIYSSKSDSTYFGCANVRGPFPDPFTVTSLKIYDWTVTQNGKVWVDGVFKKQLVNDPPSYAGKYLRLWVLGLCDTTISHILVRAYSAAPPSATDFGTEQETNPATPTPTSGPTTGPTPHPTPDPSYTLYSQISTEPATEVTASSVTLNGDITGTQDCFFVWGSQSGRYAYTTDWQMDTTGTFSEEISGLPLVGGHTYYYRAGCELGYGEEMSVTLADVEPIAATTYTDAYDNLIGSLDNMSALPGAVSKPFSSAMGGLPIFTGFLFFMIFGALVVRQEDVAIPTILGLILGGSLVAGDQMTGLVPPEIVGIAYSLLVVSLIGIVYVIARGRR